MHDAARHILIVDDEESICWGLGRVLEADGHRVRVAPSAENAIESAVREKPALVIMDVRLPGMNGLEAMDRLEQAVGAVPVIVITAYGSLDSAVAAMRNGAVDYLAKPFDIDQVVRVVRRALARSRPEQVAVENDPAIGKVDELLGCSPAMQEAFKQIAIMAPTDVPVLITGESGVGKELAARAIHRHSSRADKPLWPVNLAALSPTLIESELFGHVRGAFTGADASRAGLLELADGATVFLDEIGDAPPAVQVKLLRVLERQEIVAVGDSRARRTNFRVIAATNRDLGECLRQGTFRPDLYFRLAGAEIRLPPLRDRFEDIPLLAERFLRGLSGRNGAGAYVTEAALAKLRQRPWPGNVRELRNVIEQAALLARGGPIEPEHLPPATRDGARSPSNPAADLARVVAKWAAERLESGARDNFYEEFLAATEPTLLQAVLENAGQSRSAAAEILGMDRTTLRKKLAPRP